MEAIVEIPRSLLRKASPARQLAMLTEIHRTVIPLVTTGLCSRYPEDNPAMIRRRAMNRPAFTRSPRERG